MFYYHPKYDSIHCEHRRYDKESDTWQERWWTHYNGKFFFVEIHYSNKWWAEEGSTSDVYNLVLNSFEKEESK